jgi:hypothetical protein
VSIGDFIGKTEVLSLKNDRYITSINGKLEFNSEGLKEFCKFFDIPQVFYLELKNEI